MRFREQTALTINDAKNEMLTHRGFLTINDGWCVLCDHDIRRGERIEKHAGKYAHVRCAFDQEIAEGRTKP